MKTILSHLPQPKQTALKTLTKIIQSKVPAEMIILFGSYARGEWVEDYQETYEYVGDFDILVITRTSSIQRSIEFPNGKIERISPANTDLANNLGTFKSVTRTFIRK